MGKIYRVNHISDYYDFTGSAKEFVETKLLYYRFL